MSALQNPTLKVHEYFVRGYLQCRNPSPQGKGDVLFGPDNTQAQFFLSVKNNRIEAVSYKCTTCVVLVAYCEFLSELALGTSLTDAEGIAPESLVRAFPEVPSDRFNRAFLVVEALRSAIRGCKIRSENEQTNLPGSGTSEFAEQFAPTQKN